MSLNVTQELKPLDISYDQIFLQRATLNFEIHRRVPSVEQTDEIQKEHKHISLSLSLSLSVDLPMHCLL